MQRLNTGRILLVHGPNLNMLGKREKQHYGSFTLQDVERLVTEQAAKAKYQTLCFQSNHEGMLLDWIHQHVEDADGMLINAGAWTHYSYALLDALHLCRYPVIEVHISDIHQREPFRRISVIQDACAAQVSGLGFDSYRVALQKLLAMMEGKHEEL